jgi:hypothetical protein
MKTAMQELIEYLEKEYFINELTNFDKDKIQFLEKEKEQIIDFTNSFYDDCVTEGGSLKQSAEEYYNQTYNQNK